MKKVIGIIAEYNPFHQGHLYQIKSIKKLYPNSIIIVLVSGLFTERGDISIINKWNKTNICLNNQVDLVVEFPTLYATQSADIFAKAALKILNELSIDTLVFGSESNDINLFTKLAQIQLNNPSYDNSVKTYLKAGLNYPSAMSKALMDHGNYKIDKPNDLLALSYIKEIIKNNYQIEPISIKRSNNYHEKESNDIIISANLIRQKLNNNESIDKYVPINVPNYIYKNINIENAFKYLSYQLATTKDLSIYLTVEEGIENRIKKAIIHANNWYDLVEKIKTKRYTYNRINRMLVHILLQIKKEDNIFDPYIRILGFNKIGQTHLNKIKKKINIPIFTSYKPNKNQIFDIEYKSTFVYSLIVNDPELVKYEYQSQPIRK